LTRVEEHVAYLAWFWFHGARFWLVHYLPHIWLWVAGTNSEFLIFNLILKQKLDAQAYVINILCYKDYAFVSENICPFIFRHSRINFKYIFWFFVHCGHIGVYFLLFCWQYSFLYETFMRRCFELYAYVWCFMCRTNFNHV
jgi:hypothetical protein